MIAPWEPPPRSGEAAAIHAAADADRRADPDRYRLEPDVVLARALGDDDEAVLGEDDWREGLHRYLGSAVEDGRLGALGTRMVADTAVGRLRARRRMARLLADHPELADRPLPAPIVITGGWRTGTTFLFRLLAADPRLRAPLPAELAAPWRLGPLRGAERERALDASAAAHDLLHVLNPELAVIHDSGARLPEECVLAFGTDFRNWGFSSTTRLDGYARWLREQPFDGAYRRYRSMLQALDHGDGRRFVLKAPAHTAELDALLGAFPDACVVHLHRDIVETVTSGASLFAVFRSTYSDAVDPVDVGRFQADQTELWLTRAMAVRDRAGAAHPAATFVDVDYRALLADPMAQVHRIGAAAGLPPDPEADRRLAVHRAEHRQHARGRHHYEPAQFGLDPGELRDRFATYEHRFGLR